MEVLKEDLDYFEYLDKYNDKCNEFVSKVRKILYEEIKVRSSYILYGDLKNKFARLDGDIKTNRIDVARRITKRIILLRRKYKNIGSSFIIDYNGEEIFPYYLNKELNDYRSMKKYKWEKQRNNYKMYQYNKKIERVKHYKIPYHKFYLINRNRLLLTKYTGVMKNFQ